MTPPVYFRVRRHEEGNCPTWSTTWSTPSNPRESVRVITAANEILPAETPPARRLQSRPDPAQLWLVLAHNH